MHGTPSDAMTSVRPILGLVPVAATRWRLSLLSEQTAAVTDTIVPDDKDWTWVLAAACPECSFDATSFDATDVAGMIRDNAREFSLLLERPIELLRQRPDPATWSPLEYAAHVRDVHRLYHQRLAMMLDSDDPLYPNWDQDETAIADRYNEQDPTVVSADLVAAADSLAAAFDGVTGVQWKRPGRRSDGASFTVDTFARYLIHDPVHHLHDIGHLHDNDTA